jgi:hypothetical protein
VGNWTEVQWVHAFPFWAQKAGIVYTVARASSARPMPYLVSLSRSISPTTNALFRLGLKTLRDVLRAIPIPSEHLEKHHLLRTRSVTGPRRLRYQLGVVFDYLGFAPNLDTPPVCIVHPGLLSTRRFSIAIATDQQISKTDRTQTADNVQSFDALAYSVDVRLQNYL